MNKSKVKYLTDNSTTYFPDLTFDPSAGVLYLTSKEQKMIYSLDVKTNNGQLKKYFSKEGRAPKRIDIDLCTRFVFTSRICL